MKKILAIVFAFSVLVLSCHKKWVPSVANTGPKRYRIAAVDDGKIIYDTKCAKCHKPKPVADFTPERWVGILKSMVPKAKLDSVQTAHVTAFVNTNAKKS
jgi:hypothetical protein